MKHHLIATLLVAASCGLAGPLAYAQEKSGAPAGQLVDGEVRKVDREAKKMTIRHGPLPQLDMPTPMTMVYQVKDAALLEKVKPGDKVKFAAEKVGGAYVVTDIEAAR